MNEPIGIEEANLSAKCSHLGTMLREVYDTVGGCMGPELRNRVKRVLVEHEGHTGVRKCIDCGLTLAPHRHFCCSACASKRMSRSLVV